MIKHLKNEFKKGKNMSSILGNAQLAFNNITKRTTRKRRKGKTRKTEKR